jgi:hypothetical protein
MPSVVHVASCRACRRLITIAKVFDGRCPSCRSTLRAPVIDWRDEDLIDFARLSRLIDAIASLR